MSFWIFLTLLAFFGQVYCSDDAAQFRIIAGRKASTLEFPYMAEIQKRTVHWCGGSIIHEFFVLTAAHCFCKENRTEPARLFKILVGNDERLEGGTEYRVRKFILHPKYNNLAFIDEYDIGLARVRRPMVFNDRVQPVGLPKATPDPGEMGWLIGFGNKHPTNNVPGGHLMAVELPIVSLRMCRKILPFVADDMICAGGGRGDGCQGDSGGPLVVEDYQVGIVAWGIGCGVEGLPGVYTNVAIYKDWIESSIAENLRATVVSKS